MVERILEPYAGVFTPEEINFLRDAIKEVERLCDVQLSREDLETVAMAMLDAFRRGEFDRELLIGIGLELCPGRKIA